MPPIIGGAKSKIIKARNSEKMLIRINVNLGKEKIIGGLSEVGIMRIIFNFPLSVLSFLPPICAPDYFSSAPDYFLHDRPLF